MLECVAQWAVRPLGCGSSANLKKKKKKKFTHIWYEILKFHQSETHKRAFASANGAAWFET
jgi:hypothetical protein